MSVVIETTLGDITVDLYVKERPKCCLNFLKLCKIKYYNFNLFHTVQKGFIAQTGDPTGTGRGGHSVNGLLYGEQARYFESEKVPRIKHKKHGTISMVNCGDHMLGSQFFITLSPDLDYLDDEHCAFGEVVEGFDILEKLNDTICDDEHKPYKDIRITHTVILDDPFVDPKTLDIPPCSPEPTQEMLDSGRIGADEEVDDQEGKTLEEMDEIIQEKEAKARATILEMVGDLPDAEIAPPENVLFVCKLNPVTTDDDLEIIFSRFGRIVSCEVIRDQKTGDSLQYAFIEFQDRKACEDAYFKMDNVLIDDRRIHVDFSQSVSQYKWKGKGRGVQVFNDNEKGGKGAAPRTQHSKPGNKGSGPAASGTSAHKQWSRSPPRYSRGHASEQKRKKTPTPDQETADDRLLRLLREDLIKSQKEKLSKSKQKESSSSSSSSGSSSSSSSSSDSESDSNSKSKSKRRKKAEKV